MADGPPARVLEVERHDYTDLVPGDRADRPSMRGFDPIYTDIVDYIVRCTHRIWDERDVGLIYTHYTHNAVMYTPNGTLYDRESVVRDTLHRLAEYPDRRGMATQVVWRGNDSDGFYTSHLVTGSGRNTELTALGRPTGRSFVTRTIADCMVFENRIFREWLVRDGLAVVLQLGLDRHAVATSIARVQHARGETVEELAENCRMLGQNPPEIEAEISLAHTETEAWCLGWLHESFNRRMFGRLREVYAPNVQWHGPPMRELYGHAAVLQQALRLASMLPDAVYRPQHVCSTPCGEGGEKVAVRWIIDGHHLGHGTLGAPTGQRIFVMGMTHYHVVGRRVTEEWVVYDELAMLAQLELGRLTA